MNQVSKYIVFISLTVFMVSCAPNSKDSYLEKFESFVDRVEQNHKKYNHSDWEWADHQFEKYNSVWYLKFKDDFTLSDQIEIKSLMIRYYSYKNKEDLNEILNQLFKEDMDDVRAKVKKYIDDDMDEDLEMLKKGATAIGDSAVKVLDDVIKELKESF
jgi:hypothetical protein